MKLALSPPLPTVLPGNLAITIVLLKLYFMLSLKKIKEEEVSIDWAHRVLINSVRQQRMLKMMTIADDRHFIHDNEIELVQFIATEMQKEGLDPNKRILFASVGIYSRRTCPPSFLCGILSAISEAYPGDDHSARESE